MNPKTLFSKIALLGVFMIVGAVALASTALARENRDQDRAYRVTITNATLGQPVAPSVIATHTDAFRLFDLGPTPLPGDADYALYPNVAKV